MMLSVMCIRILGPLLYETFIVRLIGIRTNIHSIMMERAHRDHQINWKYRFDGGDSVGALAYLSASLCLCAL